MLQVEPHRDAVWVTLPVESASRALTSRAGDRFVLASEERPVAGNDGFIVGVEATVADRTVVVGKREGGILAVISESFLHHVPRRGDAVPCFECRCIILLHEFQQMVDTLLVCNPPGYLLGYLQTEELTPHAVIVCTGHGRVLILLTRRALILPTKRIRILLISNRRGLIFFERREYDPALTHMPPYILPRNHTPHALTCLFGTRAPENSRRHVAKECISNMTEQKACKACAGCGQRDQRN